MRLKFLPIVRNSNYHVQFLRHTLCLSVETVLYVAAKDAVLHRDKYYISP